MQEQNSMNSTEKYIFSDLRYICKTTPLITEALRDGCDVAQMPNGDIVVTEVKTINTQYAWDEGKQRMIRVGQH